MSCEHEDTMENWYRYFILKQLSTENVCME